MAAIFNNNDNTIYDKFIEFDNSIELTEYRKLFYKELAKSIKITWKEFEEGLLIVSSTLDGIGNFPASGGESLGRITVFTGNLIPTVQFDKISQNFDKFVQNTELTDYMVQFLWSLNLSFQLTMMQWAFQYNVSYNNVKIGRNSPWSATVPGAFIGGIPINYKEMKLKSGNSSVNIANSIKSRMNSFIRTKPRLFPERTEYFDSFVDSIARAIEDIALNKWYTQAYLAEGAGGGVITTAGTLVSPGLFAIRVKSSS